MMPPAAMNGYNGFQIMLGYGFPKIDQTPDIMKIKCYLIGEVRSVEEDISAGVEKRRLKMADRNFVDC